MTVHFPFPTAAWSGSQVLIDMGRAEPDQPVLWRAKDVLRGDESSSWPVIFLEAFPVLRRTPKGAWIGRTPGLRLDDPPRERFVPLHVEGLKRTWAFETQEAALRSFIARKDRQRQIFLARAATAEEAKWLAQEAIGKIQNA